MEKNKKEMSNEEIIWNWIIVIGALILVCIGVEF